MYKRQLLNSYIEKTPVYHFAPPPGPAARGVETFTLAPAGTSSSMSRNIRQDALQGTSQDSMNIALATACLLYTSRCV